MCEGSGESTEAQHHLLVVAVPHGRPEVGVLRHLPFALLEELLYRVLQDGPLAVEYEDLFEEDATVEVKPGTAAHVSPDGDVTGPYVPLRSPVRQVLCVEHTR